MPIVQPPSPVIGRFDTVRVNTEPSQSYFDLINSLTAKDKVHTGSLKKLYDMGLTNFQQNLDAVRKGKSLDEAALELLSQPEEFEDKDK